MKLTSIPKTWKHIKRYRHIITILLKYGFSDIVNVVSSDLILRFGEKFVPRIGHIKAKTKSRAERLRMVFEELGPTFIKVGQMLSMRPDILPPEYLIELQKLQDNVAPLPFEEIKKIIEEKSNQELKNKLKLIDEKPVASASIAQVHTGVLKDGTKVVLKIQRPNIREIIQTDMEILSDLAKIVKKYLKDQLAVDPTLVVKEFNKMIINELNFLHEGRNILKFKNYFKNEPTIYIPTYFQELSNENIIVMEYIDGIKHVNREKLIKHGLNPEIIARNAIRLSMMQIFDFGFFHADPHAGNIIILKNNVISLIDFGNIGYIDQETMGYLADLLIGYIKNDIRKIMRSLELLNIIDSTTNIEDIKYAISLLINEFTNINLSTVSIKELSREIHSLVYNYHLKFPTKLSLMLKALITAEGFGEMLFPEIDIISEIKPHVKTLIRKRYSPIRKIQNMFTNLDEVVLLIEDLPEKTRDILSKMATGKLSIIFEHRNLDGLVKELNKAGSRLSSSLIIASLIIGSSIIIQLPIGYKLFGYPIIGIVGYILAFILGLRLLWDIYKNK